MKTITSIEELLDYIVSIANIDYYEGFYDIEPEFDDEGFMHSVYTELLVSYNGKECAFFGGIVPFCTCELAFEYKGMYFRGVHVDNRTRLAFAPSKDILFDECWCIEIPVEVHSAIYIIEGICLLYCI